MPRAPRDSGTVERVGREARGPAARGAAIRVLAADDHDVVRRGFSLVLGTQPEMELVGESADGQEALDEALRLRPDVVLMDVSMPRISGLEATRRPKARLPHVCVLVVTSHEEPEYLLGAIEAGAAGYVLKDAPMTRLIGALRRVMEGDSPLDQELAARLIRSLSEKDNDQQGRARPKPAKHWQPLVEPLTKRELEVLGLLAQGKSNPRIAQELVIARPTVKTHVERIIRKLRVSDRTQAVVRAIDMGLVGNESS
jgi:DNA-binding NarL/FixJ family response regulator